MSPSGPSRPPRLRRWVVDGLFTLLVLGVWYAGRGSAGSSESGALDRFEGIRFHEVSREVGIDFTHEATRIDPQVANIEPHITAVGAAVSVTDANGDGMPDIYAVTSAHGKPNALYINRGDGTFVERAAQAGLADLNREGEGCSMGSVWADFDNDGRRDVFVYAWGRCRLFRNLGNLKFQDVTAGSGLEAWINSNAATWFDYDQDGLLDLFVGGYFSEEHDLWHLKTTRIMHDSFEFSRNGGKNRLYHNLGGGRFEDVSEKVGLASRRWTYAGVSADFNGDGLPDLYVANDYGSEELYLNRRGERFELQEGLGLEEESKSGMCVALGDVFNDGRLAVFVTNISKWGFLFQGNNLRLSNLDQGGGMIQIAEGPVADCGWAWGAQFGDLDLDGRQDLVVVNGFISASREGDYWYQLSKIGAAAGELVSDAANWPAFEDRSLSGYERTRVLLNAGTRTGRFIEVGRRVGLDDEHDGRAVALADFDRDGDLDVVIANQKGPLLLYRNDSRLARHWLEIELEATRGNRDAIGAEVTVTWSGGRQRQFLLAASGFSSQNDHTLHFGLGSDPGRVGVRVRWPSGNVSELEDVAIDRLLRLTEDER